MLQTTEADIHSSGNNDEARRSLISRMYIVKTRIAEQHALVSAMKYISTTTYISTDAIIDSIVELFPPAVLSNTSSLKNQWRNVFLRDILSTVGTRVYQRRGLHILQAIINIVFDTDHAMRGIANQLISDLKHIGTSGCCRTTANDAGEIGDQMGCLDNGSFWKKVHSASRQFGNSETYCEILAESPSLSEVRKSYITYCTQRGYPRPDHFRLVSAILRGPALNYRMENINSRAELSELIAAYKELKKQFDTCTHQEQIEVVTLSMIMEEMMRKNNCGCVGSFGSLHHEVNHLIEQFPKVKRKDAFRTQTFMKIVEKYEYSHSAGDDVRKDRIS